MPNIKTINVTIPAPMTQAPGYDFKFWTLFSDAGGDHWYGDHYQLGLLAQGRVYSSPDSRDEAERLLVAEFTKLP